jgi:ATP-binding cassette subfamily G (WHITE) protein 2 (PDR)
LTSTHRNAFLFVLARQQTTPDFLTGLTSAAERRKRDDFEGTVPSTPEEFARAWKASDTYRKLKEDLSHYDQQYPPDGEQLEMFKASRRAQQSKHLFVATKPFPLLLIGSS